MRFLVTGLRIAMLARDVAGQHIEEPDGWEWCRQEVHPFDDDSMLVTIWFRPSSTFGAKWIKDDAQAQAQID